MTQALMPEVLRAFTTRWGMQPDEIAGLLGTTPDAITEAIASGDEPAGASFEGALLVGVVYFVLNERTTRAGSDAAVATWLDEVLEGEPRRARLARATSIAAIGTALGLA